jgi:hypothetical protein
MRKDRVRRWLLAACFLVAATIPGCRCIRTPATMRAQYEMEKRLKAAQERADEAEAKAKEQAATASSDVFSVERRLESLREYYDLARWDAVKHEGLALVTANVDDVTRLEVFMMLAEACRQLADPECAKEFSEKFRTLYGQFQGSEAVRKRASDREGVQKLVGRMKAKQRADIFQLPGGESRPNYKLNEKLQGVGDTTVLDDTLPDGAKVYICKNPEALASHLEGVDKALADVIQRDPEFSYYFAIAEPPPPGKPAAPR